MKLSELKPGALAIVSKFSDNDPHKTLSNRIMEMGMTVGSQVKVEHEAPFGGAIAVRCRGTLIALRLEDAEIVEVNPA